MRRSRPNCLLLGHWLALGFLGAISLHAAPVTPLHKLRPAELEARLKGDLEAVQVHRQGLRSVIEFAETQPELFPPAKIRNGQLLRRDKKEVVWNTWQRFLDYIVALDSLKQYHDQSLLLRGDAKEDSFLAGCAAMLAQYRAALEFIHLAENNPELHKILNEPVPEIGLPAGTYSKLKFRFLNVGIATEFAAREALLKTSRGKRQPEVRELIAADSQKIWRMGGNGRGEVLTAKNALKVIQNLGQTAWLPIQTGVSEWMGDTKVYRQKRSLITREQIRAFQPKLEPGDILLERRDWYLSNVGLPGFWPHAALYIGTPEERRRYFDEGEVREWLATQGQVNGDFEALLRERYQRAYVWSLRLQEEGHRTRVLEAISEGVSFTSLEHSADCDSLAVLRPRLSKREKAQAILRAFHFQGRPYDFNFDFATDAELVCTELVAKAYEPGSGMKGLEFPLVDMLGRKVTPANVMVRQFDEQFGSAAQQLDLVLFLDAREREKRAVQASVEDFRESWKRPKWHVIVQSTRR